MKNSALIVIVIALIGVAAWLIYRQSVEEEKVYRKTGQSFMYRYGGDIISLISNAINNRRGNE